MGQRHGGDVRARSWKCGGAEDESSHNHEPLGKSSRLPELRGQVSMCAAHVHVCKRAAEAGEMEKGWGLTRRAQLMRSSSLVTTYSPRLLGSELGLGTTAPGLATAGCVLGMEHGRRC